MYFSDGIPAYMFLGKLCWQKHEHEGTGQSLRYRISGDCARCACMREAERRGGYSPRKRIDVLNVTCETCGKDFHARPSQLPRKRFCSRPCLHEGQKIDPLRPAKPCPLCGEVKPRADFQASKSSLDGMRNYCKSCYTFSRNAIRRQLGMTAREYRDWFHKTFTQQNHACAICGVHLVIGEAATDHDHTTLKLRGILCDRCNLAIGLFKESPAAMRSAIEYIEVHQ